MNDQTVGYCQQCLQPVIKYLIAPGMYMSKFVPCELMQCKFRSCTWTILYGKPESLDEDLHEMEFKSDGDE